MNLMTPLMLGKLGSHGEAIKTLHSLLSRNVLVAPNGIGHGEGFVTQEAADQALSEDCRNQERSVSNCQYIDA